MKKLLIGFIGQGFIGKNMADNFVKRGYSVVRYSLDKEYIKNRNLIKNCDIVFIAVPTPTTPKGFDLSIVDSLLGIVGKGKIAVIKSTVPPGTIKYLQNKYSRIKILHSPEFLSEATARRDSKHPFSNIIGMPREDKIYTKAAKQVMSILPKAKFSLICSSHESEIIKYAHNCSGFFQVIFFNMVYDITNKFSANWFNIQSAIEADPLICNRYANPMHKSGRGAGGNCFIKDFATFVDIYRKHFPKDTIGLNLLKAMELKNIELLTSTQKDLDILSGVYGNKILKNKK